MKKLTYICGLALFLSTPAHGEEPAFNSACGSVDITSQEMTTTHSPHLEISEEDFTTVDNANVFSENTLIRVQYFKDQNIIEWNGEKFDVIDSRGNSVVAQHINKHENGTIITSVVLDIETGKAFRSTITNSGDHKSQRIGGGLNKISCIESGGGN